MRKRLPGMPGPIAHILCVPAALLLTALLLLACLSLGASQLLTDRSLHLQVCQSDEVLDAQYAQIGQEVDKLAQRVAFEPQTVMALVTRERVAEYNAAMVDWWMGLLGADPSFTAPAFAVDGLVDAIKEDAAFQAGTPTASRTSVARDTIAGTVAEIVTETVAPFRLSLISLAAASVLPALQFSDYTPYLPYLAWALFGLCLALAGLMAIFTHRRMIKGVFYMGASAAAAGLLLCGICALLGLTSLPETLAEYSSMLALQARLLLRILCREAGIAGALLLLAGAALIALHQHRMQTLDAALVRYEAA